ncbi:MAG: cysteinyl-tRNA synthetase [Anaerolineaceae bacterium]|nr:MAG: cysteinyl-tRNA synthetase [Anaerolineaceae bacterium]
MPLGQIAFLGSGETSLAGGRIFETLTRLLPDPPRVAVLETPAGFELNSASVAGRVADFLKTRLQNYSPRVDVVPARKRNSAFSPDDPEILKPLLDANLIFMGPGSPTYLVRQLKDTLAWDLIRARHRMGATLVFASAATISVGAWVLPVYEIYKVGQDVHSLPGLNVFADFGVSLSFIPHWNNTDGGDDLDTSRCFIGMERFAQWCDMLPSDHTIVGLDEHTGLILNFEKSECTVSGVSSVSLVRECDPEIYAAGKIFPLNELGDFKLPALEDGISPAALELIRHAAHVEDESPDAEVLSLLEARGQARAAKNWVASDRIRDEIASRGWAVIDTADGQTVKKVSAQP